MLVETVLIYITDVLIFLLAGCGGFVAAQKTEEYQSERWFFLSGFCWATAFVLFLVMFAGWTAILSSIIPSLNYEYAEAIMTVLSIFAAYVLTVLFSSQLTPPRSA